MRDGARMVGPPWWDDISFFLYLFSPLYYYLTFFYGPKKFTTRIMFEK